MKKNLYDHVYVIQVTCGAATILRLLGNETNHFNTRVKKSEPGLRKQLKIDVKTTTKFDFSLKYMNILIYFSNIRCFRFLFLLSVPQGTLVCVWESFRLRRLRILFSL